MIEASHRRAILAGDNTPAPPISSSTGRHAGTAGRPRALHRRWRRCCRRSCRSASWSPMASDLRVALFAASEPAIMSACSTTALPRAAVRGSATLHPHRSGAAGRPRAGRCPTPSCGVDARSPPKPAGRRAARHERRARGPLSVADRRLPCNRLARSSARCCRRCPPCCCVMLANLPVSLTGGLLPAPLLALIAGVFLGAGAARSDAAVGGAC